MASLQDLTNADLEALNRGDLTAMSDDGLAIITEMQNSIIVQQDQNNLTSAINTRVQENLNPPYAPGSAPVITEPDIDIGDANYASQGFADAFERQKIGLGQSINEGLGVLGLDTDSLPRASDTRALNEQVEKYALTPSQYPGYKLGNAVGSVATALPLALATRKPTVAASGAAYGFSQPTEQENDLATRAQNSLFYGATALGGNLVGQGITAGARGLLNPTLPSSTVRELTDAGVQLTPGQYAGGLTKNVEDAMTSVPFLGDAINDARASGVQGFNLATINKALEPINTKVTKVGNEGFDEAHNAISKVYDEAYDNLDVVNITGDSGQELADSFFRIRDDIIKDGSRANYNSSMQKAFYDQFNLNKPEGVPGRAWGAVQKDIRNRGFKILNEDQELGQALIDTSQAMNEMASRTSGKFSDLLSTANEAHRNMRGVRNAVSSAGANEGVFMPSQLLSGIKRSDGSPDKLSFARGSMPLQNFARAGQRTLPNKLADSGTAKRSSLMGLMGGAAFGGGITTAPLTTLATVGGLLGARNLYRPGAMAAINKMRNRPDSIRALGSGFNIPSVLRAPVSTGLLRSNNQ